jgi:hypothetical protein
MTPGATRIGESQNRKKNILLKNLQTQIFHSDIKIFFIGFNKCGTTSFHYILKKSLIKSAHYKYKFCSILPKNRIKLLEFQTNIIALEIENDIATKNPRNVFQKFTAFSDLNHYSNELCLEFNRRFELMEALYPNSYFILNDRDMESWIRSRCRHRNGTLLSRAMAYHNTDAASVMAIWRETRDHHYQKVFSHFKDNSRFLHFQIDKDPITKLSTFLSPHFQLKLSAWKRLNASGS